MSTKFWTWESVNSWKRKVSRPKWKPSEGVVFKRVELISDSSYSLVWDNDIYIEDEKANQFSILYNRVKDETNFDWVIYSYSDLSWTQAQDYFQEKVLSIFLDDPKKWSYLSEIIDEVSTFEYLSGNKKLSDEISDFFSFNPNLLEKLLASARVVDWIYSTDLFSNIANRVSILELYIKIAESDKQ